MPSGLVHRHDCARHLDEFIPTTLIVGHLDEIAVHLDTRSMAIPTSLQGSCNALERRDACKGGKEANKRAALTHPSSKSSTVASKAHPLYNTRRNDGNPPNVSQKPPKPASAAAAGHAYDEKDL